MSVVNIKELGRSASAVVAAVVDTRRPAVITRSGRPVAALVPLDADAAAILLEDWALAHAPEFARSRAAADGETAGRTVEAGAFFRAQRAARARTKRPATRRGR